MFNWIRIRLTDTWGNKYYVVEQGDKAKHTMTTKKNFNNGTELLLSREFCETLVKHPLTKPGELTKGFDLLSRNRIKHRR